MDRQRATAAQGQGIPAERRRWSTIKTLDEICIETGTDKGTDHPVKGHGYAPYYDYLFHSLRRAPIKFLEIGVGGGESIRAWLAYFTAAKVFGIDKVQRTNPWNTPGESPVDRYKFVQGDQTDETMWKCFQADNGTDFDIIIDDGGHFSDQVITTYKGMWPALKSGGLYCIEDLACSYGTLFVPPGWPSHTRWLNTLIDEMHQGRGQLAAVYQFRELAILRKA